MKRILILSIALLLSCFQISFAQYSQTRSGTVIVSNPSSACMGCPGSTWSNETFAASLDGSSATNVLNGNPFCFQSTCYLSRYLEFSEFQFSLPANATVTNIIANVNISGDQDTVTRMSDVRMVHNGSSVGSQDQDAFLTATFTNRSLDGVTALWGAPGGYWTASVVNDSSFGIQIKLQNFSSLNHEVYIDHVSLTVEYFTCGMNFTEEHTDNICFGDSNGTATVHVSGSTTPYSFDWQPYGGTDSTATGLAAGTFQVAVTDGNGCTDTTVVTILHPTPHSLIITENICVGDSFFAGGAWQTIQGTYEDHYTTGLGCDSVVYTTLLIDPLPVVSLNLTVADTLCNSETLQLLAGGSPSGGTLSGPGVTGNSFSPSAANLGWNVINYHYVEETGCEGDATDSIFVEVCTSISDALANFQVTVSPNPSAGSFLISTPGVLAKTIVVTDLTGRVFHHVISDSETTALEMNAPAGLYVVHIQSQQAAVSIKLVITR
jgi:SprB repeat